MPSAQVKTCAVFFIGQEIHLDYLVSSSGVPVLIPEKYNFDAIQIHTMSKRKFLKDADPKAFNTMMAFERYLAESSLSKTHAELIKIRVSQINGCSYCIDKHIKDALNAGESGQRLYLLPVWRDTVFFTKEEQAILALAEEMTLIANKGVSDDVYNNALNLLGQQCLTEVMMAIIAMNSWNRIGITTERKPE